MRSLVTLSSGTFNVNSWFRLLIARFFVQLRNNTVRYMKFRWLSPILFLFSFFLGTASHGQDSTMLSKYQLLNDSTKHKIARPEASYAIGLYAGASNAFTDTKASFEPRPSVLVYGQFSLGKKWEIAIGLGEIFYTGKSLSYYFSKLVYDTVDIKHYTVTDVGYFTMPILFKYKLGEKSKITAGVRLSGVSYARGYGNSGYYLPAHKDTVIIQSGINPGLPEPANHYDIAAMVGYEFGFSKQFLVSLMFDAGLMPIYPTNLTNTVGPKTGNYNVSAEFGLHYLFYNYR
jgi:hypothetical protein